MILCLETDDNIKYRVTKTKGSLGGVTMTPQGSRQTHDIINPIADSDTDRTPLQKFNWWHHIIS